MKYVTPSCPYETVSSYILQSVRYTFSPDNPNHTQEKKKVANFAENFLVFRAHTFLKIFRIIILQHYINY
jgi:hypothetical protein